MNWIAALVFAAGAVPATKAAVVDWRDHRLPNPLVAATGVIGAVGLTLAALIGGEPERVLWMVAGAALFTAWWLGTHLVSPSLVGFGDVKFTTALGLYLGWFDPWLGLGATIVACLLAAPLAVYRLGRRDRRPIPLGPYLLGATMVLAVVQWWQVATA